MIFMLDYKDADNDDIEVVDEYEDDTNDDNNHDWHWLQRWHWSWHRLITKMKYL